MHPFHRKHMNQSASSSRGYSSGRSPAFERDEYGNPTVYDDDDRYYQNEPRSYSNYCPLREREQVLLSSMSGKGQSKMKTVANSLVHPEFDPTATSQHFSDVVNLVEKSKLQDSSGDQQLDRLGLMKVDNLKENFSQLSVEEGVQLKKILIGNSSGFPSQWLGQSFVFNTNQKVRYGLIQNKGGCCGVLATIQAFVIKMLLFGQNGGQSELQEPLRPSRNDVRSALVAALTHVLWQAGQSQAILALSDSSLIGGDKSFMEYLIKIQFKKYSSKPELEQAILNNIDYFTSMGGNGCILLVISAILSRGISSVLGDMDEESSCLIGKNGFCSLELVNLLLTGFAVSNAFDNSLQIDSCTLRGILNRAEVGFLSLYEHYNSCQVGSNLKTPKYPIWVVNSENHFTVLFSCQMELVSNWRAEKKFNLYYYDTMLSAADEVKLTIDTTGLNPAPSRRAGEPIPPLEHCIRTKWKDAVIHWN